MDRRVQAVELIESEIEILASSNDLKTVFACGDIVVPNTAIRNCERVFGAVGSGCQLEDLFKHK